MHASPPAPTTTGTPPPSSSPPKAPKVILPPSSFLLRPRTADAAAVATLLTGLLVVAGIALKGGRGLYRLDVVTFYLPWYSHLGERLRDLDVPGWLPYTMSGVPFAGDPQSGWGYLPAMLIFALVPSVAGFKAFVLLHILLAGLSTYALARVVGINQLGALVAAVGFALGNFLQRTVCCTIHMQVAVWVPVALLGIELAMRTDRWTSRLRWYLLTGFACSQILAGWIGQGAYYGMLAVGAYLAYRTLAPPTCPSPGTIRTTGVWALVSDDAGQPPTETVGHVSAEPPDSWPSDSARPNRGRAIHRALLPRRRVRFAGPAPAPDLVPGPIAHTTSAPPRLPWWTRPRDLAVGGIVVLAVALPLAAPALLPRLDVISRSNLADLYEEGDAASNVNEGWRPEWLADRILTDRTRNGYFYLGAALLALASAAPWLVGRRHRAPYLAVYGVAVLSLFMRWRPLADLLGVLPRFDDIHRHLPDRILVVVYVAPALLAGALVSRITGPEPLRVRRWRVVGALATPIALGVAADVVLRISPDTSGLDRDTLPRITVLLGGIVLTALAAALVLRPRSLRVLAALVILGTMVADPTGGYLRGITGDPARDQLLARRVDDYTRPNGAAAWLQARAAEGDQFRYYGYDPALLVADDDKRTYHVSYGDLATQSILVNNRSVDLSLQDIQGYNPVQIKRYVDLFEAMNADDQSYHAANVLYSGWDSLLLDMLNVRYLVIPNALPLRERDGDIRIDPASDQATWVQTLPAGRPDLLHLSQRLPTVYADATNRILESPTALPRAWLVHDADKVKSTEQLAKWQLRLVDPSETALTENTIELEPPVDGAPESVVVTSYEPDRITLRVQSSSRALVVLSEIWDPGWDADVTPLSSEPAFTANADPDAASVAIEPEHGGDTESARVYRVNYALRGVVVGPGVTEVVLHYDPPVLRNSLLLAAAGVGLILGLLALTWVYDRRHPARDLPSPYPPAASSPTVSFTFPSGSTTTAS